MAFDSYNLTFFYLDMVENGMKYIFSYDKFKFHNFNEFYFQDFKNQKNEKGIDGEVYFLMKMNKLLLEKKAEKAFLPLKITLSDDITKNTDLDEF